MNFREYKQLASRTINNSLSLEDKMNNFLFGLVGETGEVIDLMKKHFFHSHNLNKEELRKELGDICWYLAGILTTNDLNINYEEIEKLKYDSEYRESFNDLIKSSNALSSKLIRYENKILLKDKETLEKLKNIVKENVLNINIICVLYEIDFKEMLKSNIQKLIERYPEGFSSEKSIGRKEGK